MNRSIVFFIFFFSVVITNAQSIERSALSSGGGEGNTSDAQLTWTVGEAVTEGFVGSANTVLQGFQQTYTGNANIILESQSNFGVSIYPNPTTELITIQFPEVKSLYFYSVYNMIGEVVLSGTITQFLTSIDLKVLNSGQFILIIHSDTESNTYTITKL